MLTSGQWIKGQMQINRLNIKYGRQNMQLKFNQIEQYHCNDPVIRINQKM